MPNPSTRLAASDRDEKGLHKYGMLGSQSKEIKFGLKVLLPTRTFLGLDIKKMNMKSRKCLSKYYVFFSMINFQQL